MLHCGKYSSECTASLSQLDWTRAALWRTSTTRPHIQRMVARPGLPSGSIRDPMPSWDGKQELHTRGNAARRPRSAVAKCGNSLLPHERLTQRLRRMIRSQKYVHRIRRVQYIDYTGRYKEFSCKLVVRDTPGRVVIALEWRAGWWIHCRRHGLWLRRLPGREGGSYRRSAKVAGVVRIIGITVDEPRRRG
jgi:hypothetical protein